MMDLQKITEVCRAIAARDLGDLPLYIVLESDVKTGLHRGYGGFTGSRLDLILKDRLGTRWRGRGPAIVMNDFDPEGTQLPDHNLFDIALHELGHILEIGWLLEYRQGDLLDGQSIATGFLASLRWDPRDGAERGPDRPTRAFEAEFDFTIHGPAWIRCALHLHWRAAQLRRITGLTPNTTGIIHRTRWHSGGSLYRVALGDEPKQMQAATFAEILATPAPSAFSAIWDQDCLKFETLFTLLKREDEAMAVNGVLTNVIDKILGRQRSRQEDQQKSYRQLVTTIANGREPSDAEVERHLADGITPDQLRADVATLLHRRELHATMTRAAVVPDELAKIQKAKEKLEAAFKVARNAYTEGIEPLAEKKKELERLHREADHAARELRKSAPPDLLEEINSLGARAAEANTNENNFRLMRQRALDNALVCRKRPGDKEKAGEAVMWENRAAEHDARAEDFAEELAAVRREEEELLALMLQP
jgi:hypothetical protein